MMPFDREAMLDLVAAHALGVLPAAEIPHVTAFILSDPEARAEFEALRPAADAVGLAAEEPVDSARTARMRDRLMAIVTAEAASPKVVPIARGRRSALIGTGLAAAAAVVFSLVSTIQNLNLRGELATADQRVAQMQSAIAADQAVHAREHTMIADLVAPEAQRFAVASGDIVTRGQHIYFALRDLPQLPKGKVYQAWTIAKGVKGAAPSPSITFTPSSAGIAVIALPENAQSVGAVAVSVEPEGGSKAPTSKPTFVRALS